MWVCIIMQQRMCTYGGMLYIGLTIHPHSVGCPSIAYCVYSVLESVHPWHTHDAQFECTPRKIEETLLYRFQQFVSFVNAVLSVNFELSEPVHVMQILQVEEGVIYTLPHAEQSLSALLVCNDYPSSKPHAPSWHEAAWSCPKLPWAMGQQVFKVSKNAEKLKKDPSCT